MRRICVPNDSVCTLTKLLGDIVSFIDDEFLVEDLEDLAALEIGGHGEGAAEVKETAQAAQAAQAIRRSD
jgi:hypothetical protein